MKYMPMPYRSQQRIKLFPIPPLLSAHRLSLTECDKMFEILQDFNNKHMEFMKLCIYCNDEFKKIRVTYGLVVPYIVISVHSIHDVVRGVIRAHGVNDHPITHFTCKKVISLLNKLPEMKCEYYNSYNKLGFSKVKHTKNFDKQTFPGLIQGHRETVCIGY